MNTQAKNWEDGSQIFSSFSSQQQQKVDPVKKEDPIVEMEDANSTTFCEFLHDRMFRLSPIAKIKDASQNGSDDTDTIYINLSNMDGSASSPLTMLHTARAKVNGLDVKILIDQGSNSSVATKNV